MGDATNAIKVPILIIGIIYVPTSPPKILSNPGPSITIAPLVTTLKVKYSIFH